MDVAKTHRTAEQASVAPDAAVEPVGPANTPHDEQLAWFCRFFLGGAPADMRQMQEIAEGFRGLPTEAFLQGMTQRIFQDDAFRGTTHVLESIMLDALFRKSAALFGSKPQADFLPNCFVIGQARCGTTSLHDFFRDHPDIFVPFIKETNYYSHWSIPTFGESGMTRRYYAMYFMEAAGQRIRADISPYYISEPGVALRIFRDAPESRVLAILRNPIDQIVSKYNLDFGSTSQADMDGWCLRGLEGMERNLERWAHNSPVLAFHHCCVSQNLAEFYRYFDKRMRVFLFDDVNRDQHGAYGQICEFLGVPLVYKRKYWSFRCGSAVRPSAPVLRRMAAFFEPEVKRIETVIGRDLSHWYANWPERRQSGD